MDAGLAGLIGAAIGGLLGAGGAISAAAISGSRQFRSNVAQRQREARRAAYIRAVAVLGERLHAFDQVAEDFRKSLRQPDCLNPAIGGAWIEQCNQAHESAEWRHVQAAVQLEGPVGIARALEECRVAQATYHFRLVACIAVQTGAHYTYEVDGDMDMSSIYEYLDSARDRSECAMDQFMRAANEAMYCA